MPLSSIEGGITAGGSRGSSLGKATSSSSLAICAASTSPVAKGRASNTQSTRPCCRLSTASWLVSSRSISLRSGRSLRSRGRMRGSMKGAIVGITLMRNVPDNGLPAACTSSANSSPSRSKRCALATTASPSEVKRTTRRLRSTNVTSSSVSSSRMPAESVDCETKLASAARPKWPCSCSATRYCSCLMVGR